MLTSDLDCPTDWLVSDEDDHDSTKRLRPQLTEELRVPPSAGTEAAAAAAFCRDAHTSCIRAGAQRRRSNCKGGGHCWASAESAVSSVQGFTSICAQQTLSVEVKCRSAKKRVHSDGLDARMDTENELFARKCMELQCYIQPLLSILQGLRSGRYSERLSSFQESVAMDRIQRIVGVLQNPNMGGRFLSIILKIEEMLQSWFPQIRPKLRDDGTAAKKLKQCHMSTSPPHSDQDSMVSISSTHLKWLYTSPFCSLKTLEVMPGQSVASASHVEVTQDNAISSSTDSHTGPARRPRANAHLHPVPLPFKISSPCLERLLQAKESIIAPRTTGDGGMLS